MKGLLWSMEAVDQIVLDKLQYTSKKELYKAFSAEQVDAIALAIDNLQKNNGFILGDQTGIGKGRVVAAMIKYSIINDKTPVCTVLVLGFQLQSWEVRVKDFYC